MPVLPILLTTLALWPPAATRSRRLRFSGPKTAFDPKPALAYVKIRSISGRACPAHWPTTTRAIGSREMKKRADRVIVQSWTQKTTKGEKLPMRNIRALQSVGPPQRVLYLTHWDTRPISDNDQTNLGKRGAAVAGSQRRRLGRRLVPRVGRPLKKTLPAVGVDLVFVDGEDWGVRRRHSGGIRTCSSARGISPTTCPILHTIRSLGCCST